MITLTNNTEEIEVYAVRNADKIEFKWDGYAIVHTYDKSRFIIEGNNLFEETITSRWDLIYKGNDFLFNINKPEISLQFANYKKYGNSLIVKYCNTFYFLFELKEILQSKECTPVYLTYSSIYTVKNVLINDKYIEIGHNDEMFWGKFPWFFALNFKLILNKMKARWWNTLDMTDPARFIGEKSNITDPSKQN